MRGLRIIGLVLFAWGAISLALLYSPWEQLALDYSVAHVASRTDRRAGNAVEGSVDMPIAIAGSVVVMITGLWIGLLVPLVMNRGRAAMIRQIEADQAVG